MQSLKSKILEEIINAYPKSLSIDEVFNIAGAMGHKQSLAERKCRELCQEGRIKAIKNDKGHNIAYQYAEVISGKYPPPGSTFRLSEVKTQERLFNLPRMPF